MKTVFLPLILVAISAMLMAQTPQALNYQAVARNISGAPIPNQAIGVQFQILQGSSTGASVYTETHSVMTNSLGLFNLQIGAGDVVSGSFDAINWDSSSYYLKVGIDPNGGTTYEDLGIPSQMLSVPYALMAENVAVEKQTLSLTGNELKISQGNSVVLPLGGCVEEISDCNNGADDTRVTTNKNGVNDDQIHMDLGVNPTGTLSVIDALVLRKNSNGNTMLEIKDGTGNKNLFIGEQSGNYNTPGPSVQGQNNTSVGYHSLANNLAGDDNTAFGTEALRDNNSGRFNTAIGSSALLNNYAANPPSGPYGNENTAVGHYSMRENIYGMYNTASGVNSLRYNTSGNYNTATGRWALFINTTGNNNTSVGASALAANQTGSSNTAIGYSADVASGALNNASAIGANAIVTTSDAMILGNQVNVGIGLSNNPIGPQSRLEIDAAPLTDASGLRFRQLNSGSTLSTSQQLSTSTPAPVLSVNSSGDVVLVGLIESGSGGSGCVDALSDCNSHLPGQTDTKIVVDNGSNFDEIHMDLGVNPTGTLPVIDALVLRKNVNGNTLLEIKDGATGSNTFVGQAAGVNNKTTLAGDGVSNTAIGFNALNANVSGYSNTSIGNNSMHNNIDGCCNVALGDGALYSSGVGTLGYLAWHNTAIGYQAMFYNTLGKSNVAIGNEALYNNTRGFFNTAIGDRALFFNKSFSRSTAVGWHAMYLANDYDDPIYNTIETFNTAIGVEALMGGPNPPQNTGTSNTAVGDQSLMINESGSGNTAVGRDALLSNVSGNENTAIGYGADAAGVNAATLTNATAIGANAKVATDNSMILGDVNVNVGIGPLLTPLLGPQNKLEIDAAPLTDASGLSFRQLTSASPVLPANQLLLSTIAPTKVLGVDATGKVVLVGLTESGISSSGNAWDINGNTNIAANTNFLGTQAGNAVVPLDFRLNNIPSGRIDPNGPVFLGYEAGLTNISLMNTGIGFQALKANTTGKDNTSTGHQSLLNNTGSGNTANGSRALLNNLGGGNNTAIGLEALLDNTTGQANTASGVWAMHENMTGDYNTAYGAFCMQKNKTGGANTAVGVGALDNNVAGFNNTAMGVNALQQSTSDDNTAMGWHALKNNGTGIRNTALGVRALESNISTINNNDNTAIGASALELNNTGYENTAIGAFSLNQNDIGYFNTATGAGALQHNDTGSSNTANGIYALQDNKGGISNTAIGAAALQHNQTGDHNTASGVGALLNNTSGGYNTATGEFALENNNGYENTATGYYALRLNAGGQLNTAVGQGSLLHNVNGNCNTGLGSGADLMTNPPSPISNATVIGCNTRADASNSTAIGASAVVNTPNTVCIGNANVTTIGGTTGWTICSDGRFKSQVQPDVPGLNFIKKLKPVTYHFNYTDLSKHKGEKNMDYEALRQKENKLEMGFVAQDIEKAMQESGLIVSNLIHVPENENDNYSVAYSQLVVPLVQAVQEQQTEIDTLKAQVEQMNVLIQQNQSLQSQLDGLRVEMQSFRAEILQKTISDKSNGSK